jgi:hypothetical protein
MTIKQIFETTVVTENCNVSDYIPSSMINQMLEWINDPRIKTAQQQIGTGYAPSTCDVPDLHLIHLTDSKKILDWIIDQVIKNSKEFINGDLKKVSIGRNWFNVMYKGSEGAVHNHYSTIHPGTMVVAIFYVQVPENSANLFFIQNNESIIHTAIEGELVIHDAKINHSVSIHNSDTPRICLVLDLFLEI